MLEESGVVTDVSGERARVRTERKRACGNCAVNDACGTSLLEHFFGRRPVELTVLNQVGARVGDRVTIGIRESSLLGAAVAAYLVPLLALMLGAAIGQSLGGAWAESASLLGAALGFVLALLWLRGYSVRLAGRSGYQPSILRRLGPTSAVLAAPSAPADGSA
ncbi:SoxR reducing system RseC family protein [Thiorhodococcus mannitoliphagus]|uniref:SoxR reducing system RseC family protein n=2 Tax=Thiorhodococcus mannitoliphagus TaxID=329406 RepID=A0A6P1DT37_9GAMM|nr:SoxR reducing system RseC family protein [Thiorhodococcus mannitoliphagus]